MNGKIFFALVAVLGILGFAFAASEPMLQVAEYSTVPQDVYPGTLGYLQLTISNNGDATAQTVSVHYDFGGDKTSSLGDISAGSTAQASVPFRISADAGGSIQPMNVDIYYNYQSGNGLSSKKTSLSVPLTIKQYKPLEVRTVSIGNPAIAAGEKVELGLLFRNTGGVVNNLVITAPANSTFLIEGSNQKEIGDIPANSQVNVSLELASSSDTKTGTRSVPIIATYQDASSQPTEETVYVGPISVLESSTQYRISLEPLSTVEIGSQVEFQVTLENAGSSPVSGTLVINSTDTFTPLGVQTLYFDAVPRGSKTSRNITIGVAASKASGYYTLPIRFTPNAGQAVVYNAGVAVEATPELTVALNSQSGTTQVEISNTGNSQVRSVYASATASGSQVASESFIGTLNVDDFATLSVSGAAGGSVDVEIRYKDSNNIEHDEKETLDSKSAVFAGQPSGAGGTLAGAGFAGRNGTRAQGGLLGGLFGGGARTGAAGSSSPLGVIIPIAAVFLVLVGSYFAYRKYVARKKANAQKPK